MQMFLNALLEALWFVNTTAGPYINHTDASAQEATTFTPMAGAAYHTVCKISDFFFLQI